MEDDLQGNEDRTEEATPERREEFREKGQIAVSREISSVAVLCACVIFLTFYAPIFADNIKRLLVFCFNNLATYKISSANILNFFGNIFLKFLFIVLPIFLVTSIVAIMITFLQTRFNWSWKRIAPDFSRINPLKGVQRMVSLQALMELGKGIGKMSAVGLMGYLVLKNELNIVPSFVNIPVSQTFSYWGSITQNLFWGVAILLLVVAGADYFYNFMSVEKKLKMTKQEVKEDLKRREVDPHVKGRIRHMQRDLANKRMIEVTREATVVITNPTHYSIALKYEFGMKAPVLIAKGKDFLALKMREVAKEMDIPMVENRPLAQNLYKTVEIGQEIPETLYKAVSEIIRFVFKLKGIKINTNNKEMETVNAS